MQGGARTMLSPIKTMFQHFPLRAYTTVLVLVLISWYTFRKIRQRCQAGTLDKRRGISGWLLINYIMVLLFLTVLGRRSLDYVRYNSEAFYSYRDVLARGDPDVAIQIVMNILVFVPVGILGSFVAMRWRFLKGLLLGAGLSVCIEALQLVLRNGTCELDDLISNTIGTSCGCIVVIMWLNLRNKKLQSPE